MLSALNEARRAERFPKALNRKYDRVRGPGLGNVQETCEKFGN